MKNRVKINIKFIFNRFNEDIKNCILHYTTEIKRKNNVIYCKELHCSWELIFENILITKF